MRKIWSYNLYNVDYRRQFLFMSKLEPLGDETLNVANMKEYCFSKNVEMCIILSKDIINISIDKKKSIV